MCWFYTLMVNSLLEGKCQIHGFEPTPITFQILKDNISSENVFLNNIALDDKVGESDFYIVSKILGMCSLIKPQKGSYWKIRVKTTTLDKYCQRRNLHPTFLKIDVEHAEDKVIRGGKHILKTFSPLISLEFLREDNEAHQRAVDLLKELGYFPSKITKQGDLLSLPENIRTEQIPQFFEKASTGENLIFEKKF